jgi:hypothetical protein
VFPTIGEYFFWLQPGHNITVYCLPAFSVTVDQTTINIDVLSLLETIPIQLLCLFRMSLIVLEINLVLYISI